MQLKKLRKSAIFSHTNTWSHFFTENITTQGQTFTNIIIHSKNSSVNIVVQKYGYIRKQNNIYEHRQAFSASDNTPYEKIGDNEPVSIADEMPFDIPDSWEWVRASSLGQMIRGKGIKRTETVSVGMPCVRYGEIYTSYDTEFSNVKSFIPKPLYDQCNLFRAGDIVFTLTGENKPDIAKAVAYLGERPVAAGGDLAYWTDHGMNPL